MNFMNGKLRVLKHLFLMHWFIYVNPHLWFHTEFPLNIALMSKILGHGLCMALHDILTQNGRTWFSHYLSNFGIERWWKEILQVGSILLSTLFWWEDSQRDRPILNFVEQLMVWLIGQKHVKCMIGRSQRNLKKKHIDESFTMGIKYRIAVSYVTHL